MANNEMASMSENRLAEDAVVSASQLRERRVPTDPNVAQERRESEQFLHGMSRGHYE